MNPTPPNSTPTERVAGAVFKTVQKAAMTFCPTARLEEWPGTSPPPFNDTQIRQQTGLFGFQVGEVERSASSGVVEVHWVVHAPRKNPAVFDAYRDWIEDTLTSPSWWPVLAVPLPLLSYTIDPKVVSGSVVDDKKTFLSQRLIFTVRWEKLEVS